ncbi:MAG: hypothetical protein ACI8ZB_002632 [Desulforhopalus sp.]
MELRRISQSIPKIKFQINNLMRNSGYCSCEDTRQIVIVLPLFGNDKLPANLLLGWISPDFSPTKFFAGRDTGHEAVIIYRKCSVTKQLRINLLARRVPFLI